MYKIRIIKTTSSQAVQVVRYHNNKRIIVKHIGSVNKSRSLEDLKKLAYNFIDNTSGHIDLFSTQKTSSIVDISKCKLIKIHHKFIYEKLSQKYEYIGFNQFPKFLRDISIIRIIEPASKLKSLELLKEYFDINYSYSTLHRRLYNLIKYREDIIKTIINFAKRRYNFDFKIVFYDVTTLYFESFKDDELRKAGYSKDHKHNQPQILIGLVVNKEGFPITYEIFEGNTFEGHTMLPVITSIKEKYLIESLTVVADAAMVSEDNINRLKEEELGYIVGARMGNLSKRLIDRIYKALHQENGKTFRVRDKKGILICHFSSTRYNKDRHELKKRLRKAEEKLKYPSSITNRVKFVKNVETKLELNKELIEKHEKLLGIKGYYTNLEKSADLEVIEQYSNLWKIEKAFRISKSDLQIRPIYHHRESAIRSHILICFVALSISRYLETETGLSINKLVRDMKKITDAVMLDKTTNKTFEMRMEVPEHLKRL